MTFSHAYEEPSLSVIVKLASFLLLLNVVHKVLDKVLYCGLVGQILVGVLFGTPGAKLLDDATETVISNLGYLGLLLLVYQGGLSTSLSDLVSASVLSLLVALTGITLPIALSFLLLPLSASSPLQCFSAGAALSATSLGTALATLSSSGLLNTHVGTVLTSAALFDDIAGLIMLQIVSELSAGHGGTAREYGKIIGRALGASLGLVVLVMLLCRIVLQPVYRSIPASWAPSGRVVRLVVGEGPYIPVVMHTSVLLALIVAGSYAGTSVLLSAFIAGVMIRWWDDDVTKETTRYTGLHVYSHFYAPPADRILKPFFFASIGFSIPIAQMFHGGTVWRGLVYALLMFLGKLATGLWLVPSSLEIATRTRIVGAFRRRAAAEAIIEAKNDTSDKQTCRPVNHHIQDRETFHTFPRDEHTELPPQDHIAQSAPSSSGQDQLAATTGTLVQEAKPLPPPTGNEDSRPTDSRASSPVPAPAPAPLSSRSLRAYAPAMLGLAMTARGEIGFLIASVAQSRGVFESSSSPSLYLVAVWAIVLCTVGGPIMLGALVQRIKRRAN